VNIGYARVSTEEQNLDRQIDILKQAGCDRIYEEKVSGIKKERTELNKILEFTIFAGISQFERDLISQRTIEGLNAARARGKKGGRPKTNGKDLKLALKMYNSKNYSIAEIKKASCTIVCSS
jgi:DNA invertase Pin-like site-specific DNA recombinase